MAPEKEDATTANWMKEVQKGYIRIGVLILLNKKPFHGYEIMKEINNRTKGFWQPTPGGVYPILRDLEKSGYIRGEWQTQRNRHLKVYKITKSGQAILRNALVKQNEIFNSLNSLFQEFARDVLNIPQATTPMVQIPKVFSPFLEEEPDNVQNLEAKRLHTLEALKNMRSQLKQLDGRITELKNGAKPSSTANSK